MIVSSQGNPLDDQELIARVRDGDESAFAAIYERYRPQLLGFATRITGSAPVAEEATQDTFLSLWRSACAYDTNRGTLKTWLLAMVRNRSIDCLRREGRHAANVGFDQAPSRWLEASARTDEEVAARDEAERMRQLVLALPAAQRQVVALTYFDGLSHTEVASRVGIPLGTVKGRQRLAMTRLHRALGPRAGFAPN